MKVVITGGMGFLGLGVARALAGRGTLAGSSGGGQEIDAITLFDAAVPDALPSGLDEWGGGGRSGDAPPSPI